MKKIITWVFLGILAILFLVSVYYMVAMSRIPVNDGDLGEIEEEVFVPQRPGTRNLVLTGPIIRPLIFSIDLSRPGTRALDWSRLQSLDPTADVRITATIGSNGQLLFDSVRDVYCPGHTQAGQFIAAVLRTWSYTPYMEGPVIFSFHVGAVGKKVTIDVSKLKRKQDIDPDIPIRTGKLYLIENDFSPSMVKVKTW
jgi:hypothetical protein